MRWIFMLLFVVGCGEVKAKQPDGGGGDGGADDAGADGPSVGEATVAVTLGGVAQSGLRVNFQESDGSLTSEATTDANGVATGTVHAGAMVTVAVGPNDLVTVTGVNPGEKIELKYPRPFDDTSVTTVSFGASSEATSKYYYRADTGDDNYVTAVNMTSGARTLDLPRRNLDGAGRFNVVAAVYDMNNKLIAYSFVNYPPTGATTTVSVPTPWRTDVTILNVSVSGAPDEATEMRVYSANEHSGILYAPSYFPTGSPYPDRASIVNGSAAVALPYLGSFGDFVQTEVNVSFGTTFEKMRFVRRVPRPAGAFVINASDMPARIGERTVDSPTPTRPVVTWTVTGSTANADATVVDLGWRNADNAEYLWHVYLPPDATTFSFPEVSTSIAAQAPGQTTQGIGLGVSQHCLEPLAGYAAFHLAPPIHYSRTSLPIPPGFNTWFYSDN